MKKIICVLVAAAMMLSLAACGGGASNTPTSSSQTNNAPSSQTPSSTPATTSDGYDYENADTMKVAILQALTGSLSYYGDRLKWALGHEVDEINAAGGVLGKKLELSFYDIGSNDESMCVAACEKAILDSETEGYSAFYGPMNGAPCLSCAPLICEAQIPAIYISTSPNIRDGNFEYMWNHRNPADVANMVLAGCAKELWGINNVAVVYYTQAGAIIEKDTFIEGCKKYGINVEAEIAYQIDDVDFTAQATQVASIKDKIDGVFLVCDNGETPALVIAALYSYGFDKVIMTNNAGMNDTCISTAENLAPGSSSNMKSTTEVNLQNPEVVAWSDALMAIDSSFDRPGWYEACATDALRMFCEAAKIQGSIDPVEINKGLAKIKDFKGLTATYTNQGDNTLRSSVWACEVKDKVVVATKEFTW